MKLLSLNFLSCEWANFFFLIDNLAFPIDSMHEDYNHGWVDKFGQLSESEKDALERYKILKRSVWDKGGRELLDRFEASFYQSSESDSLEGGDLSEILTKKQLQEIDTIFESFKDRFQSMWVDYRPILVGNQALLQREVSSVRVVFNESFSAIGKLYGSDNFSEQVEIYLMMRPDPGFRGGRMVSQKPPKIMVESGVFDPQDKEQMSHLWLLLLHELTHACFESDEFFEFLDKYLAKKPPLAHFLEKYPATKTPIAATRRAMGEMIINSVEYSSYVRGKFEHGYTGGPKDGEVILEEFRDYFKRKSIKDIKEKRSTLLIGGGNTYQYIAWKLEEVVRHYLENGKGMDEKFLDGVYKVLEEFPNNLLKDLEASKTKKG